LKEVQATRGNLLPWRHRDED